MYVALLEQVSVPVCEHAHVSMCKKIHTREKGTTRDKRMHGRKDRRERD